MLRWLVFVLLLPVAAAAQQVLVVDLDRAFAASRLGQSLTAELRARETAVQAENDRVAQELKDEEAALTARRAQVTPEEFRALADAFDTRVRQVREERDAEEGRLQQLVLGARARFVDQVGPLLQTIVTERGASVVLNRRAAGVVLTTPQVDVTDALIAAIDAQP